MQENNENDMNYSLPDSNTDDSSVEQENAVIEYQQTNGPADQEHYDAWVAQQQKRQGKEHEKNGSLNEESMNVINAIVQASSQRNRGSGAGGANTNRMDYLMKSLPV